MHPHLSSQPIRQPQTAVLVHTTLIRSYQTLTLGLRAEYFVVFYPAEICPQDVDLPSLSSHYSTLAKNSRVCHEDVRITSPDP